VALRQEQRAGAYRRKKRTARRELQAQQARYAREQRTAALPSRSEALQR
jgi:hypothetical protein